MSAEVKRASARSWRTPASSFLLARTPGGTPIGGIGTGALTVAGIKGVINHIDAVLMPVRDVRNVVIPGPARVRSRRTGLVPSCSRGYVGPVERDRGAGGSAGGVSLENTAPGRTEAGERRRLNPVRVCRFTTVCGTYAHIMKHRRADVQV